MYRTTTSFVSVYFDQAGKGTASDASLLDAIDYAAKLAVNR